jgi:hypothetical protein
MMTMRQKAWALQPLPSSLRAMPQRERKLGGRESGSALSQVRSYAAVLIMETERLCRLPASQLLSPSHALLACALTSSLRALLKHMSASFSCLAEPLKIEPMPEELRALLAGQGAAVVGAGAGALAAAATQEEEEEEAEEERRRSLRRNRARQREEATKAAAAEARGSSIVQKCVLRLRRPP